MNKVVRMLEVEMKMEQVMKGFMVELEIYSKKGSLGGQALDMCLKLVAPEYSYKHWNRHKEFHHFLQLLPIKTRGLVASLGQQQF